MAEEKDDGKEQFFQRQKDQRKLGWARTEVTLRDEPVSWNNNKKKKEEKEKSGDGKGGKDRREEKKEQSKREEKWEVSQRVSVVTGAVNNPYFTLIFPEEFTFSATFSCSLHSSVSSFFS